MTAGLLRGTLEDNIGPTPAGIIGSNLGGPLEVNVENPLTETTPSVREQIEGHLSALISLLKEHNRRRNVSLIHLSFDDVEDRTRVRTVVKGKEIGDADLKRPFKENSKYRQTCNRMMERPIWKTISVDSRPQQTQVNGSCRCGGSIDGWVELRQQFTTRFSTRRACFKDPTEITKIVRKANETLVAFKERWIVETSFITGVPKVMKISSFMDAHKCLELAKRYSDKVPKTVDEMMTRLHDFVRSEEAFASKEVPKGEVSEASRKSTRPVSRREDRFRMGGCGADRRRNEERSTFNNRDRLVPYRAQTLYQAPRDQGFHHPRQLEMALESGKLNHLIKDVRQRGRGNAKGKDAGKDKVINMIRSWPDDRKRKSVERDESWMKAPIVFPHLSMGDASDEPLIVEAVMEGYLVRRVYMDQGASVEVMFEHCFKNLSPAIRSCLRSTQMDFVGFARGVMKPLRKIELEVVFGDRGLFRKAMINFTVVRAPSPYNVIFGRTSSRSIRAVSSTIYSMVKFPTPRGITTLVTRPTIISECRRLEKKQMVEQEVNRNINQEKEVPKRVDLTEQTLVNLAYPDQLNLGGNQRSGRMDERRNSPSGIRANPKKTKAISVMQSPRTLIEMQSLSEKLVALKRFVPRFAKKSLPFFETLKDIKKENNNEYRWTESAENAFQEMKKVIVELPLLTTPVKEETIYEATKVLRGLPYQIRNDTKQGSSVKKVGQVLGGVGGIQRNLRAKKRHKRTGSGRLLIRSSAGLHMARKMKVQDIDVKVDWKLVASQINRSYVASSTRMIKYLARTKECIAEFKTFAIQNIPRNLNQKAEILSKMATHMFDHFTKKVLVELLAERSTDQKEVGAIVKEEEDNWMTPIIRCLAEGVWPKDKDERRALRMKINQYVLEECVLFKKAYLVPMLRYVGPLQANYVIREIHMRSCRIHIRARSVVAKATRQGYYWPTMHRDARNVTQKCDSCQGDTHGILRNAHRSEVHSGESYKTMILLANYAHGRQELDAKNVTRARITEKDVKKFVWDNIVCRFGIPRVIVTDNGTQFVNDPFKGWYESLNIKWMNTAVAHPQANGLVERANKILMEGIKARLGRERVRWVDELPNVL
nr:reverse transcriptase domain-containing protein [Tanacetum cinerariifolium]